MIVLPVGIVNVVLCVTAAVLTLAAVKLLGYFRRKNAQSEAQQIILRAGQEMENRRREVELELKELAIQQKADGEKELRQMRRHFPRAGAIA